jgi:hypothetical protein
MFQLQLFFLLHCDEWDRVVALPRHKFVTGATLLQLTKGVICFLLFDYSTTIYLTTIFLLYRGGQYPVLSSFMTYHWVCRVL